MGGAALHLCAHLTVWAVHAGKGSSHGRDVCATERCLSQGPTLLQVDKRRRIVPGGFGNGFEPVDGGSSRACRGADAGDNHDDYYTFIPDTQNLEACKALCRDTHGCKGVEFSLALRQCEVWTRPAGIGASSRVPGYTCLRYTSPADFLWTPADGGIDRACGGSSAHDDSPEHWKLHLGVATLEACKEKCVSTAGCSGVEYRSQAGRCKVWLRPLGGDATRDAPGSTCWRYGPPSTQPQTPQEQPRPTTREGCACLSSWVMHDHPKKPCLNHCCNPDDDPAGLWCFVHNETCQGSRNWGYCHGTPQPARPLAPVPPETYPGFPSRVLPVEWEHFTMVNRLRAQGFQCPGGRSYPANSQPLKFDCRLWAAARGHSQDMAKKNYFAEDPPGDDAISPWDRAAEAGLSADLLHIAAACDSAACVLERWKESDLHCNHLLEPTFKAFAIAAAFNSTSTYKYYWTDFFKSDEVQVDSSCYPPPHLRD